MNLENFIDKLSLKMIYCIKYIINHSFIAKDINYETSIMRVPLILKIFFVVMGLIVDFIFMHPIITIIKFIERRW